MAGELRGRRVAILIAQRGTEQVEFEEPKKAVEEAGASVDMVSDQTGVVLAVNNDLEPGDSFTVEKASSTDKCPAGKPSFCVSLRRSSSP